MLTVLALTGCADYSIPVSINGQQHTLTVSYTCACDVPTPEALEASSTFYQLDGHPTFADFGNPQVIDALSTSFDAWNNYVPSNGTQPPPVLALYTDTNGNYTLSPPGSTRPPTAGTLSQDTIDLVTSPPVNDGTAGQLAPSN